MRESTTVRDGPAAASGSPETVLEVDGLSVTFPQRTGDVRAVRDVSFTVRRGEFLAVVGESGSGKSVSATAVMGLLPSTARVTGDVRFQGRSLLGMSDRALSRLRGNRISMVFQDPLSALNPVHTVGAQVEEALRLHAPSTSPAAASARAVELLRTVGIPDAARRARAYPHEFSGGMRQRAMIAMAIANDPDLIIADEPTTALDVTIQAQIMEVLQEARRLTGAAVLLITHDLGVVAGHADRVAVMYAGTVVEQGTVEEIFYSPRMPYTLGLLRSVPNLTTAGTERLVPLEGRPPALDALGPGCPFAPRCPLVVDRCRQEEPALLPVGTAHRGPLSGGPDRSHAAACWRAPELESGAVRTADVFPRPAGVVARTAADDGETVLEVTDLVRHFPVTRGAVVKRRVGTVRAVDGVSFALRRGQTLGLVGESGCGKSTTVLEILEMARPQHGTIRINGRDVAQLTKAERRHLRRDVQVVFQDPMAALDPRLPVADLVGEPLTAQGADRATISRRVAETLELVGLDPAMASRYPHEFSGGQRQRLGIARALSTEPRVLVLDEPVSALDVSIQAGVINLLEDLRDRLGLSYVFVAHDLAVVRQIADTVAVMYLGRIVEQGPVAPLYARPRHPYTQALISAVPVPDPRVEGARRRILLEGDLPGPTAEPHGCPFRPRCPLYRMLDEDARSRCRDEEPELRALGPLTAACHHAERNHLLAAGGNGTGTRSPAPRAHEDRSSENTP